MMQQKKLLITFIVFMLLTSCQAIENTAYIEQYRQEAWDLEHFIEKAINVSTDLKPAHYHLNTQIQLIDSNDGVKQLSYGLNMQYDRDKIKDITMSFSLHPDMAEKLGIYSLKDGVFATTLSEQALSDQKLRDVQINEEDNELTLINSIGLAALKVDTRMLALYKLIYVKLTYTLGDEQKTEFYKIEAAPSKEVEDYFKSHI